MTVADVRVEEVVDSLCPVERAVRVIGGKWKVLILWHLQERGTLRFAELQRALDGVTHKVLSHQLRELERDGMIARRVYAAVPPRVEYSLTALGETLRGRSRRCVRGRRRCCAPALVGSR